MAVQLWMVALGAATFATINYLTRWLLPGVYGQIHHHHVTMVNPDPASRRQWLGGPEVEVEERGHLPRPLPSLRLLGAHSLLPGERARNLHIYQPRASLAEIPSLPPPPTPRPQRCRTT